MYLLGASAIQAYAPFRFKSPPDNVFSWPESTRFLFKGRFCYVNIELLRRALRGYGRVFIQTHNFPDPDALGSAYGLRNLLRNFGIEACLCHKGGIDNVGIQVAMAKYDIPFLEYDQITDMTLDDKIILVDGQKFNANMTDLPGDEVACVDHHPINHKSGYLYEDIRNCGACASIITAYFGELGVPIDEKSATLPLYGLQTDTDYLRRGVTALDIDAFSALFPLADGATLQELSGSAMSATDLEAFGKAIEKVSPRDGLGLVAVPFACGDYLIARIADFLLQVAEIETAVVYCKRPDGVKFSARTQRPDVHCGEALSACLLSEGGSAGGHPHVGAGFLPREKAPALYAEKANWEETRKNAENFRDYIKEKLVAYMEKIRKTGRA